VSRTQSENRHARLAAALRENLKKRKARARAADRAQKITVEKDWPVAEDADPDVAAPCPDL
jgi:hypothetical protein